MSATLSHALPSGAVPSLHARLRHATSALHQAVERGFGHLDLSLPGDYGRFLAFQAAAVLPMEAALDAAGIEAILPDWPARRRGPDLLKDLADLGLAPGPPLPFIATPGADAMGCAYVLEGSRLGGAVLMRRLAAGVPTAFLRPGQGLWQTFLARLDSLPPAQAPQAEAGACRAFRLFLAAQAP